MKMTLILASASPRRRELITILTNDFSVHPANIDETPGKYQTPAEYALRVATGKARQVAEFSSQPVLGADTVVCLGARIFGKPADKAENVKMLRTLSNRWHCVITAVALCKDGNVLSDLVTTRVCFAPLTEAEINQYVASGDGLDKAGGYGIQGAAGKFIAGIDGCYYNVVGLPLTAVNKMLRS